MRTAERTERSDIGWGQLLRAVAIADILVVAAAAAVLQDLEAAALTVGLFVAALLLRWRSGLVGRLVLGGLFANIAFWTIPGALSNLRHGEGFGETLLPATLAVISVAGLWAVGGTLWSARRPVAGARAVGIGAVAVLLVVTALAATNPFADQVVAQPGDLTLTTENTRFSTTSLEARSEEIGVFVANRDLFWHTFTVPELGVSLNVPVGAQRRLDFDAPRGTYRFICAIPGHTQAGMEGTLRVT